MSLTSVGKLFNKGVLNPNGRGKCGIYQFLQLSVKNNAFHMLLELHFVAFYHDITRTHISKQYHKNRNLATVLIIRKTRKQLTTHSHFASKLGNFTTHSRFH